MIENQIAFNEAADRLLALAARFYGREIEATPDNLGKLLLMAGPPGSELRQHFEEILRIADAEARARRAR